MKKTKILVPAAAILALGMAAAVTGTVAWFSANTIVSASNMSVYCSTSKSLVITNGDTAHVNWAVSATSVTGHGNTNNSLIPASNASLQAPQFFGVTDNSKVLDNGQLQTTTPVALFNTAQNALAEGFNTVSFDNKTFVYARLDTFYIKLDAPSNQKVNLAVDDCSITAGQLDITKALRIGMSAEYFPSTAQSHAVGGEENFVGQTGTYVAAAEKLYAEDGYHGTAYPITAVSSAENEGVTNYTVTTMQAAPTTVTTFEDVALKSDFYGQDVLKVSFLWWYEGQDSECITSNALKSEQISLTISFTYTDAQ